PDVLYLINRSEFWKCSQRLQIARPGWQVCSYLHLRGRVETSKQREIGSFGAYISNLQQSIAGQLMLDAGCPLLSISGRRVLIHAVVTRETGGTRLRKPVLDCQHGLQAAWLIILVVYSVANQIVRLDRKRRREIDPIAGAKYRIVPEPIGQPRGDTEARSEI